MPSHITWMFVFYTLLLVLLVAIMYLILSRSSREGFFIDTLQGSLQSNPLFANDIPEKKLLSNGATGAALIPGIPTSETPKQDTVIARGTDIYFVDAARVSMCDQNLFRRPYFFYGLWMQYNRRRKASPKKRGEPYGRPKTRAEHQAMNWRSTSEKKKAFTQNMIKKYHPSILRAHGKAQKRLAAKFSQWNALFRNIDFRNIINSNCKYTIPGWKHVWENQEQLTVTNDPVTYSRGPPETWFRVQNDGGSQNPLLKMTGENDAVVTTITPREIYQKVCNGVSVNVQRVLPNGTYLVLNQYPVKSIDVVVNNQIMDLTNQLAFSMMGLFEELKVVRGKKETLYMVPRQSRGECHIFMADLCGNSMLYKKVPIVLSFGIRTKLKTVNVKDTLLKGTTQELMAKLQPLQDNLKGFMDQMATIEKQLADPTLLRKNRAPLKRQYNMLRMQAKKIEHDIKKLLNEVRHCFAAALRTIKHIFKKKSLYVAPTGDIPGYTIFEDLYSLEFLDPAKGPIRKTEKIYILIDKP